MVRPENIEKRNNSFAFFAEQKVFLDFMIRCETDMNKKNIAIFEGKEESPWNLVVNDVFYHNSHA